MERLQAVDEGMLFWFANHHSPVGNAVMEFCTRLGDRATLLCTLGAAVIFIWLAGRPRTALILMAASLLGIGIAQSTKYVVKRERPDVAWRLITRPKSPSFPSSHALNTMALYGSLALLTSRLLRRRMIQALVLVGGFTLPLVIGISRIYLGVHYPSDVLAGWTAGLACALLALWTEQRWSERHEPKAQAT
jgi:undecaprenyl-diphosphatase